MPHLPPSGGFVQARGVAERPGGAGANTAIALASTGAVVHMVGYVGDDEPGTRLRAVLDAAGVDAGFVVVRPGHTFEVVILVEPSVEHAIIGMFPGSATGPPQASKSSHPAASSRARITKFGRWIEA